MRYNNPLRFLAGAVLAAMVMAGITRSASAKPPQAPTPPRGVETVWVVTDRAGPCGIAGCDCGCASGGPCACATTPNRVVDGWTWDAKDRYWWKWAPAATTTQPIYAQPTYYAPQQLFTPAFGGYGGFGGGGCAGGRCSGGG